MAFDEDEPLRFKYGQSIVHVIYWLQCSSIDEENPCLKASAF